MFPLIDSITFAGTGASDRAYEEVDERPDEWAGKRAGIIKTSFDVFTLRILLIFFELELRFSFIDSLARYLRLVNVGFDAFIKFLSFFRHSV